MLAAVTERVLSRSERRTRVRARLDHLTSRSVVLRPDPGLRKRGWRVRISVNGPDRVTAPAAHLLVVRADGSVSQRGVRLTRGGFGRAVVRFDTRSTRSVTMTLANASTRFRCGLETTLTCRGTAVDDRQKFVMTATLEGKR